jgi:hypothetical protein
MLLGRCTVLNTYCIGRISMVACCVSCGHSLAWNVRTFRCHGIMRAQQSSDVSYREYPPTGACICPSEKIRVTKSWMRWYVSCGHISGGQASCQIVHSRSLSAHRDNVGREHEPFSCVTPSGSTILVPRSDTCRAMYRI